MLLWLWHGLAAAAPVQPLAWEPPYATGAALKRPKKKQIVQFSGFSIFTELCNHEHYLNIFITPKRDPIPLAATPHPPLQWSLATTNLLFVCMDWADEFVHN